MLNGESWISHQIPSYYQYYNNVLSVVLFLYGSNWMVNTI